MILQIDAETLNPINAIVNVDPYGSYALTSNLCVVRDIGCQFTIYKRGSDDTLSQRKYYISINMSCMATTPNKICFIIRDGSFTFLRINDV
jgi:hypothetical protein